jgi:Transposase DDE domain.
MVVTDGNGLPIGLTLASARPHEVKLAVATLETVRVPRRRGRPRRRPRELVADMAYDSREFRQWLWGKGIKPTIPVRGRRRKRPGRPIEVGPHYAERWKVERLFSWLGELPASASPSRSLLLHLSCFRSRSVHRYLPATILEEFYTSILQVSH